VRRLNISLGAHNLSTEKVHRSRVPSSIYAVEGPADQCLGYTSSTHVLYFQPTLRLFLLCAFRDIPFLAGIILCSWNLRGLFLESRSWAWVVGVMRLHLRRYLTAELSPSRQLEEAWVRTMFLTRHLRVVNANSVG
jgi:hypothetical protein